MEIKSKWSPRLARLRRESPRKAPTILPALVKSTTSAFENKNATSNVKSQLEELFPRLERSIRRVSQDISQDINLSAQTTPQDLKLLETSTEQWGKNPGTGQMYCQKMASFGFLEVYSKLWKNNLNEIVQEGRVKLRTGMRKMQSVLKVMVEKCKDVCQLCLKLNLHKDLFRYLSSETLKLGKVNDQIRADIILKFIFTLEEVIKKVSEARQEYRDCDAVNILQSLKDPDHNMITTAALKLQAYIVDDSENEHLNQNPVTFGFLAKMLQVSIQKAKIVNEGGVNRVVDKSTLDELVTNLDLLNKLAANDKNKVKIVESGALPQYITLMGAEYGAEVQKKAVEGVWILSFICYKKILENEQCVPALQELQAHTDKMIRKLAEGALWSLQERSPSSGVFSAISNLSNTITTNASYSGSGLSHVFISYHWGYKNLAVQVAEKLELSGVRVWIDDSDMPLDSVMQGMADAVERASFALILMSKGYKDSPNCRAEAEYIFRLHKNVVPVKMEASFKADGWLGLLIGSQRVLDLSKPENLDIAVKDVIRKVKGRKKSKKSRNPVDLTEISQEGKENNERRNSKHSITSSSSSREVENWSHSEVEEWLKTKQLSHLRDWFTDFDGLMLLEYFEMSRMAPESFFNNLFRNQFKLKDALAIQKALKDFHN